VSDDDVLKVRLEAAKAALEWTKQITTLATGTLVLSATFLKDLAPKDAAGAVRVANPEYLRDAWLALAVSIVLGLLYLGAVSSFLSTARDIRDVDIYRGVPRYLGLLHVLAFLVGMVLFVVFAVRNLPG